MARPTLTDAQRRLVRDNLGLVGTHLRRVMTASAAPRRDREWDDLFQEGCLGLTLAAATFDPHGGCPFAAYAIKRIHAAVSRATHRAFATVHVPEVERAGRAPVRAVVSLQTDPPARAAAPRHDPFDGRPLETLGDRLRRKLESAVRRAARAVDGGPSRRSALVRRLADERLLVPDADHRWGLRRVARETGSTYARVTYAERRITDMVRAALDGDLEFHALRALARRSRWGIATLLDRPTRERLVAAMDARLLRLFNAAPDDRRALAILRLAGLGGWDLEALIRAGCRRLTVAQKVALSGVIHCTDAGDCDAP